MFNVNNEDSQGLIKQVAFIIRKKYWSGFLQFCVFVVLGICWFSYGIYDYKEREKAIKSNMGLVEGVVIDQYVTGKNNTRVQKVEYLVFGKKHKTTFIDGRKDLIGKKILVAYSKDNPEVNYVLSSKGIFKIYGIDYKKHSDCYVELESPDSNDPFTYVLLLCVFGSVIYIIGKNIYVQLRADLEELNRDGGV